MIPQAPTSLTARVELVAAVAGPGHLDGGWWPRSDDLTVELPALLDALADRITEVALVGYHRTAWATAPDYLQTAHDLVRLQGFVSDGDHTVVVIGSDGRAVTLLVVPPSTSETTAHTVLRTTVAQAHDTRTSGDGDAVGREHSVAEIVSRLQRFIDPADPHATASLAGMVDRAAAQFDGAPVQAYVPILVEHIVRTALARPAAAPPS